MKKRLLPENIQVLQERFGNFHDAVIHYVKFDLFSKSEPTSAQIILGARDLTHTNGNEWINVVFEVDHVIQFHLKQERRYLVSIVYRMNIGFIEDEVYLDLGSIGELSTLADFEKSNRLKNVNFLLVGKECYWYTAPYNERAKS